MSFQMWSRVSALAASFELVDSIPLNMPMACNNTSNLLMPAV